MDNNSYTNNPAKNRTILFSIIALFILITIIGISFLSRHEKYHYDKNQTYVDNLSNYDTPAPIPFTTRDELYRALNTAIRDNSTEPPFYGAVVRENSYQYYSIAPYIIASRFIIDVPALEQSYSAYITWSTDDTKSASDFQSYIELSCAPTNQNIYSNFSCVEPQPFYPERIGDPENYLPYTSYDANNSFPLFTISESPNQEQALNISISICNNDYSTKQLQATARTWLQENTKIPLDDYEIQYSTTCDGDAI